MKKYHITLDKTKPIGIFDSGIGGTSIWKEIHTLLPHEDMIYLADSKNAPYGLRTKEEIIALSEKNVEILLNKGCKIIVVACNTATTNAIKHLREKYPLPFIGIEPAIKPASLNSTTKSVGILATKGTLSSELFNQTISIYRKGINVIEQEGAGIVELIEGGKLDSEEMTQLLKKYLQPMLNAEIDYLVLGCSHYPYLIPILEELLPKNVKIIDSGQAVAQQTKSILDKQLLTNDLAQASENVFYTNSSVELLQKFVGKKLPVHAMDF